MGVEVPEDLTGLKEAQLHDLASKIQAQADGLGEDAAASDDGLAQLEALAAEYQRVVDELASREEAAQARQDRVQAALDKIGGGADTADPTDPENPEPDPEQAAQQQATEAQTAPDGTVVPDGGAPADPALVPQAAATEGAATLSIPEDTADGRVPSDPNTDPDAGSSPEEAALADQEIISSGALGADPVAALSGNRPEAAAPVTKTGDTTLAVTESSRMGSLSRLVDNGVVNANSKGKTVSALEIATLICQKQHQLSRMSPNVSYEPIVLASAKVETFDFQLGTGHEENFSVIESAKARGRALVASGGNCAPLAPNWDVFNVAEPQSPVENALPTVGAPRGGIRYITPPAWPEAQAGVRYTTEAEDAAGYTNQSPAGTTAPKPCVHLECQPIVDCEVDAVSQCVTFGNLQYRTFPEQVEVFMEHLAVAFAQRKEIHYLDAIQAGSTAVTAALDYGATRSALFNFVLAAHAYRKRNHMNRDAVLDVLAPDTMLPLLKADMVNDLHLGLTFLNANEEQVARELFDSVNLNVEFYYDFSTSYGSTAAMQQAQAAGPLNAFPSVFRAYMYAPGTWIRLDGGTLDVGIVRDSTLNSTNDLQIFAEEWNQVCKVGIESIRLDLTLCPSGVGPAPVTGLICHS